MRDRFVKVAGALGVWSALPVAIRQFGDDGRVAVVALVLSVESLLSLWFLATHVKWPRLGAFALHTVMAGTALVGLGYWRMDDLTWREMVSNSAWVALVFGLAGGAAVAYLSSGLASLLLGWRARRLPAPISRGEREPLPTRSRWAVSLVTLAGIVTASSWLIPVEFEYRQYPGIAWTGFVFSPLVAAVGVIAVIAVVSGTDENGGQWLARTQIAAAVSGIATLALFAMFYFPLFFFGVGAWPAGPMADMLYVLFGNTWVGLLVLTTMFAVGLSLEFPRPYVRWSRFGLPVWGSPSSMDWLDETDGIGARTGDGPL